MLRALPILLFICLFSKAYGQSPVEVVREGNGGAAKGSTNGRAAAGNEGPATVSNYSIPQKRLLVLSTAKFIHLLTQDIYDQDSIMTIACRMTGQPFLLPYSEDLEGDNFSDEERKGIEQAIGYLHKPGSYKNDLDSASKYIHAALALNKDYACLNLLGEYYRQSGKIAESKKLFLEILSSSRQQGNRKAMASAWEHLGLLHSDGDSLSLVYLTNALILYQQMQSNEKSIELLSEIAVLHLRFDISLMEKDLIQIVQLQQKIGYRHTLYVEFQLSFATLLQARYLEALQHVNAALVNKRWSGIEGFSGAFFTRLGATYESLGKNEEALVWFKKALDNRHNEMHLSWYKGLFYATTLLADLNRAKESLDLLEEVTSEFPPINPWEKAQIFSIRGYCYEKLDQPRLADKSYRQLLELSIKDLGEDQSLSETYWGIATFYVSQSNLKLARLFLNRGRLIKRHDVTDQGNRNYLMFKIDSMEGNYRSALKHHILYKLYDDSTKSLDQRKKMDELTIRYGVEKKDQNIKLLEEGSKFQGRLLLQAKYTRDWILAGVALLLITVGLLVYNIRLKQRTNKILKAQQMEISKQNVSLHHLVKEKDWLVKEIHHRVKNNLQTVMGLLGTQAGYLKNEAAISAITDSQRRVQVMSLIHQKLYQSENLSAINMPHYIQELVDYLCESFNIGNTIRFSLEIERTDLDLAHCIPLGLILNEAITNAFKYAFPNGEKGTIFITFKRLSGDQLSLTIKDDGIGLPVGFNPLKSDSMGMNLMRGLSQEIGAQFTITRQGGTEILII